MGNRYGTMSRVVGVPNRSPPITARANAAFCSSPGPPMAIGIMPTTMAAAVISTGRILARIKGSPKRAPAFELLLARKCHQKNGIRRGDANRHDRAHQRGAVAGRARVEH